MPQLNPTPWLAILVFSWAAFLIILPTKVISHTFTNEPNPQKAKKPELETWNWPWY
uniref:ATP synthase complex subunit 8 n=1 Tax=Conger japonicus TaxID=86968 RepID=A0A0F7LE25_CONJA|nr:ATP synthase F0 subunit 8 [Conger erebennus]AKH60649.1 ATPase subunit 8 [Conger japonicus]UNH92406.1 ATP synthase F0 subunit 8 [Conger erebennus]